MPQLPRATSVLLVLALAACGQSVPAGSTGTPTASKSPADQAAGQPPATPAADKRPAAPKAEPEPAADAPGLSFVGIGGQPGQANGETGDGYALVATSDGGLLAGAAGVLRLDGAGRWTAAGAGLDGNVRSLALGADGTVLAGLRGGRGVARLAPGAAEWQNIGGGFAEASIVAVAATPGGTFVATGAHDVQRWNAAAGTWDAIGPRLNGTFVQALAAAPNGDLLAGATAAPYRARVLRLSDGEWTAVAGSDELPGSVRALVVTPGGAIHASVETADGGAILTLAPGAERWIPAGTGLPGGTPYEIAMSPAGDLIAGGATGGVYRLAGGVWSRVGDGLPDGPLEALAAGPRDAFARVGGRLYALRDATWRPLDSGLDAGALNAIAVLGGRDVVAATRTGLARREQSGGWAAEPAGQPASELLTLAATADGSILAGTAGDGVLRRDRGGRWTPLAAGLPAAATVRSVALAPDGTTWAGTALTSEEPGGAYRLAPGASAWASVRDGLGDGGVTSLALGGDGTVWAGVNGGSAPGVYRLPPGARTWTLAVPIPDGVSRLALARDGAVLVGTYGAGTRRLDTATGEWTPLGAGLPGGFAGWVLELEDDPQLGLLAGTNSGLYQLTGAAWKPVDAGLPRTAVTDVVRDGDRLVVGTLVSGVFASAP